MTQPPHRKAHIGFAGRHGFALVVSVTLLVLLSVIALGMLSLSAVTLRSGSQDSSLMQARANARLALMIALGELQKEMGPDMRVSAESSLFDSNHDTKAIEGVAQSRWLASYNAWGSWLTATYQPPGGGSLRIGDTYSSRRAPMFRRWLLSLPAEVETSVNAPDALEGWNDTNSVVLVGKGSLGGSAPADQITRAYLKSVDDRGRYAWWIGGENHKAVIDKTKENRSLAVDQWQSSQGDTAEVGVGGLPGFSLLDADASVGDKLVSTGSLGVAGVDRDKVRSHFFDLTAHSRGVIASVRGGHLKKDLSLLFEQDNANMPAPYKFDPASDTREPSIRPMSPELAAKNPKISGRHFQSWTNMRHYYRMYRQTSDATVKAYGASNSSSGGGLRILPKNPSAGNLAWGANGPYTDMTSTCNITYVDRYGRWPGYNNYWRFPIIAKVTFILSLKTTLISAGPPERYWCTMVYTPVYTFWNPYNVQLRIPDNMMFMSSSAYDALPLGCDRYLGNTLLGSSAFNQAYKSDRTPAGGRVASALRSGNGGDVVFQPGEIRVFSPSSLFTTSAAPSDLYPGFDPQAAVNGEVLQIEASATQAQNRGVALRFWSLGNFFNFNYGCTPGSLTLPCWWNDPNDPQHPTMPMMYQNDWFNVSQQREYITLNPTGKPQNILRYNYADGNPVPVAYVQFTLKGQSPFDYESIDWEKDWRSRNWIYGAPYYFGHGLFASERANTLHTQRIENPYMVHFGPTSMAELPKIVFHTGGKSFLGSGSNPFEKVSNVAALELPSAPISSLAGFSGMRINPGWTDMKTHFPQFKAQTTAGEPKQASLYAGECKVVSYQSGVTGPGAGNSFLHPVLPRTDVYRLFENSISMDQQTKANPFGLEEVHTDAYCDYWDHVFLLNDALWDDYFVSSLADQTRPGASAAESLNANIDRLVASRPIANSRYVYEQGSGTSDQVKSALKAADGYLKAAQHLMVDGMFNVNSTSEAAWYSLFAGIRERKVVYRDNNGDLKTVEVPDGKRIALSRFDTEVSGEEMDDPEFGATMSDGSPGWSGVRFLDDKQLMKLAEECVKQVKKRGPFLNFSEFINRRLSDDALGTMGALQSAIDHDDASPDPDSINGRFKTGPDFMLKESDLSDHEIDHEFETPEAAVGSRFAGIPGYVIQSDLLKPIANTMSVRDDTFRIRAYGEARDKNGAVLARAWCEAIVQRMPDYVDPQDAASESARRINAAGAFEDNPDITDLNRKMGRKFRIDHFRWLGESEI